MKKLTFKELVETQQRLSHDELVSILGGNGALTGGAGTAADPYVISATYYTVGNIPGASDAVNQFNGAGQNVTINGKIYKYDIKVVEKADLTSAMAAAAA